MTFTPQSFNPRRINEITTGVSPLLPSDLNHPRGAEYIEAVKLMRYPPSFQEWLERNDTLEKIQKQAVNDATRVLNNNKKPSSQEKAVALAIIYAQRDRCEWYVYREYNYGKVKLTSQKPTQKSPLKYYFVARPTR